MSYSTVRMKFALSANNGGAWGEEPDSDCATPVLRSTEITLDGRIDPEDVASRKLSAHEIRATRTRTGDILVVKSSGSDSHLGKSGWVDERCAGMSFSNFIQRLRVSCRFDPRFTWYFMNCSAMKEQVRILSSTTTGLQNLSGSLIGEIEIPCPPIDEQRRIAGFLDTETSRIDLLLADQHRMAEVLEERRIAVTSHLIYGRDSDDKKRDSTIPTVGLIPSAWQVARVKTFMREIMDLSATGDEELLTVSHLTGVTPRSEKDVNMFLAESMIGYKRCRAGDLVINTLWAWMGALGISGYSGIVSPAYGTYRMTSDAVDGRYIDLLVRTPEYVTEMTRFSKGVWTSRLRLYPEYFLSLSIPIPPLREQQRIVEQIASETIEHGKIKSELETFAERLAERRQALITAAVTGQIDVATARGAAI